MTINNITFGFDTNEIVENDKRWKTQLRYYQINNRNDILKAWERGGRSVMYQSPTGSGKTPTIASIVKIFDQKGLKTLTIAHREELVDNIRKEYLQLFEIETGAIKAGLKRDYSLRHQVASIGTYVNALDFNPDLIITDEGHHCIAQTYRTIYAAHPEARLLMVTATPYRLSGQGFTEVCDELVLGLSVAQLERMGNLIPAQLWAMTTYTHDQIAQVHIVKGEYSESEMADLLSEARQIMSVVDTYIEKGEGKQMMLYATTVEHSKKLVEAFEWRGIKAGHVDGKTKNRHEVFDQFINKKIQVLSNCEIATEGNNIPAIEIIGLARKTKSLSLYLQMVGRASRPHRGKWSYLLFDFVDNYWEHGLPNREHDWRSHFIGISKKDRQKREDTALDRQFEIQGEDGDIFISDLAKLPDGFKGQILKEVDPSNTRHAEALRRRQAQLDAINQKRREKEAVIERRLAEIQRRKEEKEAEIQRIKDEKLAKIQRKIAEQEAAIQRRIDAEQARIQKKLDEKAAKLQKIEDARLAKIREEDIREESWRRSALIRDIQYKAKTKRDAESRDVYRIQDESYKRRRALIDVILEKNRLNSYSFWGEYSEQQRINEAEAAEERWEYKMMGIFHRLENQFEIGIRMTHNFKHAVTRMVEFNVNKRYPMIKLSNMIRIVEPYWKAERLFTQEQFDTILKSLETMTNMKIDRDVPNDLPADLSTDATD